MLTSLCLCACAASPAIQPAPADTPAQAKAATDLIAPPERQQAGPSNATAPGAARAFVWPDWARTARIAGAYFDPADSDAHIDARLDALAAQHVSVVLTDSPWGQSYAAWVDDSAFEAARAVVARVAQKAHARGLKVVLYQTGLELVSPAGRNPFAEHPDWLQRSLDGRPLVFNDIDSSQAHWMQQGEWNLWVSPCDAGPTSFRALALSRVQAMLATGVDGLWIDQVYLPADVGNHAGLWPSHDPCSARAFLTATGLAVPAAENWDDPAWRQWIVWRHAQIVEFLLAVAAAARAVNPDLVFMVENASADTAWATQNANDPAALRDLPDMSAGHELETIGDRIDEGQTGMQQATLDEWLSFRAMLAFARAADRPKPSWILTYGYQPRDSAQLAGLALAEGANFYETQGPAMDGSVGADARTRLFAWMSRQQAGLFGGAALADVAVLFSPRTRDLLDSASGSPYDPEDSIHFAAYRATARWLHQAHIPFEVVLDTDTAGFNRYAVLIAPEVQLMSDATIAALRAHAGRVILIGNESGAYDEWFTPRPQNPLAGLAALRLPAASERILVSATTGLLSTTAPATVQFGIWDRAQQRPPLYAIVVVNTAATPAPAFHLTLRLPESSRVTLASLSAPFGADLPLPFAVHSQRVEIDVPAGIDSVACIFIHRQSGAP